MNYPKVTIICSHYLLKFLGTSSDFNKLKKFKFNFEKYFKRYERRILKLIERYSGFKWEGEQINVWLFEGHYPSVSFPLLLNTYGRERDFTLFSLIHELVHNIMLFKIEIKENSKDFDSLELEAITQLITKNVAKNFFDKNKLKRLCKKAEFNGYFKYVWERERELEMKWDLEKYPFTYFIKGNKKYKVLAR